MDPGRYRKVMMMSRVTRRGMSTGERGKHSMGVWAVGVLGRKRVWCKYCLETCLKDEARKFTRRGMMGVQWA